ncbi:GNAT family N-acetyltransferase [Stackebrandtia soli]|uniref:GNAT family N-acetyltransferase n=1 Tax=Stackebrandtia soli TaxID=1892856 RepID=UPI0039EC763C
MQITPVDIHDDAELDAVYALRKTASDHDTPERAGPCAIAFPRSLRHPRAGSELVSFVARVDGHIVGGVQLFLPTKDNTHFAGVQVVVHPEHRRRGIGRALLDHGLDTARELGRTTVSGGVDATRDGGGPVRSEAGRLFAQGAGFTPALTLVNRTLDFTTVDAVDEERLMVEALAKSGDYETIAWSDATPPELQGPLGVLQSTFISEAPMGDLDLEEEKVDVDHVRETDAHNALLGYRTFGVAARLVGSTEIAAFTRIGVPTNPGDHAEQWMTIAAAGHRGHRLGLRVKLENHRLLRASMPNVRYVHTDNADVNGPMIRVNDALGFRPTDLCIEYQRAL